MKPFVVTISREYGSGGRIIGRELATELGIDFYDKEIITLAAQECGLPQSTVQEWSEKKTNSMLYDAYIAAQTKPLSDEIYLAKADVIRKVAEKGACVIVGTCGDYVLRDRERCLRVFIYAPLEERVRRAEKEYGLQQSNATSYVKKRDKQRSGYYNSYATGSWGDRANYDLMINSSIGISCAVGLLKSAVKNIFGGDTIG